MATGRVVALGTSLQPVLELFVYGRSNVRARVQGVIDTGYTGHLTLPARAVHALDLSFQAEESMTMANDELITFEVYTASIDWDGQLREIKVHLAEGDALIGMEILHNHDLHLRAIPDGPVSIEPVT